MVLKHTQDIVVNAMTIKLDQVLHYKYLGSTSRGTTAGTLS